MAYLDDIAMKAASDPARQLHCKLPFLGLRHLADLQAPLAGAAHHIAGLQHGAGLGGPPVDPACSRSRAAAWMIHV